LGTPVHAITPMLTDEVKTFISGHAGLKKNGHNQMGEPKRREHPWVDKVQREREHDSSKEKKE